MDRATGKARGFAFAEFSDATKAADAIRRFDSFELRGRRLRVNDAADKPPARAPRPAPNSVGAPRSFDTGAVYEPPPTNEDPRSFRRGRGSRRGIRGKKRSLRW